MRPEAAIAPQSWRPMRVKRSAGESVNGVGLAARLHDATTRLALGLALLPPEPIGVAPHQNQIRPIHLLEDSLASLRRIGIEVASDATQPKSHGLAVEFKQQADRLAIDLDLRILGSAESISPALAELVRLIGREALVNVRRHSASRKCQITLDLIEYPFEFSARNWGTSVRTTPGDGQGLQLLGRLAEWLGCRLVVTSHPGLATELSLFGPTCPSPHRSPAAGRSVAPRTHESHVRRSEVAGQSFRDANSAGRAAD